MKRSTKRFVVGTVAASAVVVAGFYAFSRLLVKAAVKREGVNLSKSVKKRISGGLTEDPQVQDVLRVSKRVQNYKLKPVSIVSRDGLKLNGRVYPCENPKRIVLAMHGWRSSWDIDFGSSIDFLHEQGCIMVYPDQRGQNGSEGEYIGFGVLERFDCIDWLNYITETFGTELPIYLLGVSMGASTVLMASGQRLPDCVKGIIADCGFTCPRAILKHVLNKNVKVGANLTYSIANLMIKRKANFGGDDYSTIDALSHNEKPVLFVHGTADTFVPVEMTFENYLACKAPKEMFIVPGAGHGMSYLTATKGYQNKTIEFFSKCENNGYTGV